MRLALGLYLNRAPDSLRFIATQRGKPQIVDASMDVRFNLSHAGERALLAIALQRDVGIDIEEERPIEVFELAERFFSPSEVEALRAVQAPQRAAAFFRCWTRKEAFVKALGEGMFFPLNGFDVSVDDDTSAQLLRGCAAAPNELWRWRVMSLPTERPYWAALAAAAGDWRVVRWTAPGRSLHRG
jgi:4'-phosphopantetheinyl transferase